MPAQAMNTTKAIGRIVKALSGVVPRFGSCSFVKVEAGGGTMRLTATDGERLLSAAIPAEGSQDPLLFPGLAFLKALKGAKVLRIDGGTIETNAGSSTFQVEELKGHEDFEQEHPAGTRPLAILPLSAEAIDYGCHGVSRNPTQPVLSSVLLDLSCKGVARLVSTDGYRLVIAEAKAKVDPKAERYILHGTTMGTILGLLDGQQEVRLFHQRGQMTFQGPGWTLTTRLVQGNYPRYERILPGDHEGSVVFERGAFLAAAKAMRKAADEYNRNARLYMDSGTAVMELVHPDGPVSTVILPFDGEVGPMVPGFDHRYLMEMAEATPGEKLVYAFNPGSDGTVTFRPAKRAGSWSYRTHLMPVRWGEATSSEVIQAKVQNALLGIVDTFGQKAEIPEGVGKKLARVLGILMDSPVRLEALKRVRLESTHGWLSIAATDMAVTFVARIPGPAEYGPVLVEGDRFRGMLRDARKLALGDQEIRSEGLVLEATGAEHYPVLPAAPNAYSHRVRMAREALALVTSCVKKEDRSGRLSGVRLELEPDGGVSLIACDGDRLAVARSASATGQGDPQAATVPLKAAQLLQALSEDGAMVDIQNEGDAVTFRGSWWTLTARTEDKAFPNYRKVIPEDARGLIRLDRKAAQKALAVVGRLEDRTNKAMAVTLAGGIVTLKASKDGDEAESSFPCQAEGITEGAWRMHQASLRDFVALLTVPTLEVRFGGETGAWMIRPLSEDGAWSRMGVFAPWPVSTEGQAEVAS